MRATHEAIVNRAAFAEAVKQRRRRAVRVLGARSKVPRDVLLYAKDGALVVDTPTLAICLPMSGEWKVCISVPANALALAAPKLKSGDSVSLVFTSGSLVIDDGAFVLPAKEARRPAPTP
jgi:hypothetical protein